MFNEAEESFSDYLDRMDAFMAANKVENELKCSVFLSIIGSQTFKLLKNLCSPDNPKEKTYAQLCEILTESTFFASSGDDRRTFQILDCESK